MRRLNGNTETATAMAKMLDHQARASQPLFPMGVSMSRPGAVSSTGVTGWCSAKAWTAEGVVPGYEGATRPLVVHPRQPGDLVGGGAHATPTTPASTTNPIRADPSSCSWLKRPIETLGV